MFGLKLLIFSLLFFSQAGVGQTTPPTTPPTTQVPKAKQAPQDPAVVSDTTAAGSQDPSNFDVDTVSKRISKKGAPHKLVFSPDTNQSDKGIGADGVDKKWSLHEEFTSVTQHSFAFEKDPYEGPNSFSGDPEAKTTYVGTVYMGYKVFKNTSVYMDLDFAAGATLSDGSGLAAFVNGDANRTAGSDGTGFKKPLLSQIQVVQVIPLGTDTEYVADDQNQVAEHVPIENITIRFGRYSTSSDFDQNKYAADPHRQFLNWCFTNNCAWDFSQDQFGFIDGVTVELNKRGWALRASYTTSMSQLGVDANGPLFQAYGSQIEFEKSLSLIKGRPGKIRVLVFENRAHMRNYDTAIEGLLDPTLFSNPAYLARLDSYSTKRGVGVNLEQEINSVLGVFARAGQATGQQESIGNTAADKSVSAGLSFNGSQFKLPDDTFGIGAGVNFISKQHQQFLQDGGTGIQLGDGNLTYGPEKFFEAYYAHKLKGLNPKIASCSVSPDLQLIKNPGYNQARGPVKVVSLRFNCKH